MHTDDTIAAISTPPGTGGISIIRISGADSIIIADKIFKGSNGKSLLKAKTHTINHGYVKNENGDIADEVLISVMRAPKTYTGENIAEINCHGGIISTKKILDLVLEGGARLALPGEFTKRAFMNGKMDLCKAESVIDIINSKTSAEHSVGVNQLRGYLSDRINEIRNELLELISHIQVLIDFADEDLEPLSDEEFLDGIKRANHQINELINSSVKGQIIKEGIKTAIVGKPNVGKSSLLNLLCGSERAIVTDIEGTTRDAIEECISLGNVMLRITDTAGIRKTEDVIESIGVEKSKNIMKDADLVIFMTDAQKPLDENDYFILNSLKDKKTIALLNKAEDGVAFEVEDVKQYVTNVILFSVKDKIGIGDLASAVEQMFSMGELNADSSVIITNVRHTDALKKASKSLVNAIDAVNRGIPLNMTFIDIEEAISALGEITGLTVREEIVDRIFHNFCVGK